MPKGILCISFNHKEAAVFNFTTGEAKTLPLNLINNLPKNNFVIVCNLKNLANHTRGFVNPIHFNDILELFAFLHPCLFNSGSIYGLAKALNLNVASSSLPSDLLSEATMLSEVFNALLKYLENLPDAEKLELAALSRFMSLDSWGFSEVIAEKLNLSKIYNEEDKKALEIWGALEEIKPIKSSINNEKPVISITAAEVEKKLVELTKNYKGLREKQACYAKEAAKIFSNETNNYIKNIVKEEYTQASTANPRIPKVVFAEAGTGIGKTLGYLAGCLAFIEKNPEQNVVISTYSKTLQKQIFNELKNKVNNNNLLAKVALVKGSSNYACLLKFEHLLNNAAFFNRGKIFTGILARWLKNTTSGDIEGGDLVPFLLDLAPFEIWESILNKREECIYSKCKFYKKCFITKVKNNAKQANIIISNHTLTLLNNFNSHFIIFDEAHHLHSISDEVFSNEISGLLGIYLRHWLLGKASSKTTTTSLNGLKQRLNNILQSEPGSKNSEEIDFKIKTLIDTLIFSSSFLPTADCLKRITNHNPENAFEEFLYQIYLHVLSHNSDLDQFYSLESKPLNLNDNLLQSITSLKLAFNNALKVALSLKVSLIAKLAFLEETNKQSLEEFINTFDYICINTLSNSIVMLDELIKPGSLFIYRFLLIKEENRITNIGYFRNYINPMEPLSRNIINNCEGVLYTSATLNSTNYKADDKEILQKFSLEVLPTVNLVSNVTFNSPFNYGANSEIIILSANYSKSTSSLAHAITELFVAAGGGALAIFTAVNRMKNSYNLIREYLKNNNIKLYTQYHNQLKNTANIIEVFKEDINSCLIGTDSFRDGIDIPGKSLRMVVFEKVPWPKKDILNITRSQYFGKEIVAENIRFKLRQAFGRIIRKEDDKGIFVILTPAVPTEFLSAFPENVNINKINLAESITLINQFFNPEKSN